MKGINSLFMESLTLMGQKEQGKTDTESVSGRLLNTSNNFSEIYDRYIKPNEEEFRRNYQENSGLWSGTVGYEACALDFIPVADKEYVIVDKNKRQFQGTFKAVPYEEDERIERTIDSVLIAGYENIHEILSIARQKKWTGVYVVFNQAAQELASFFKLTEFPAAFPANTKFFAGIGEMRQYFRMDHDAYLPRKIFAAEPEPYEALVKEFHKARIQDGIPSSNVFLSICIPTYNRGKLALASVRHALNMEFDAEVEIIVSDNASTVETDEYQEIANMRDSRVRYLRAPKNKDFPGNIIKCLKASTGHYVIFYSDEDHVVLENIRAAIEWLITRPTDMGFCIFSGKGRLSITYETRTCIPGSDAALEASYASYITGCCFNLDNIKSADVLQRIDEFEMPECDCLPECNYWFLSHPHCMIGMLLSKQFHVATSSIEIYQTVENENMWDLQPYLPFSYGPGGKMLNFKYQIELASEWLSGKELEDFVIHCVGRFFGVVSSLYSYKIFGKELKEQYRWLDIWIAQYKNCIQTVKNLEGKIDNIPLFIKKLDKHFFRWLVCVREQRLNPPEENLLPAFQAQVAKYHYDKGVPIEEIDFDEIEKDVKSLVQEYLSRRG